MSKIIKEIISEENIKVLSDFLTNNEKNLCVYGSGMNGKSTLLKFIPNLRRIRFDPLMPRAIYCTNHFDQYKKHIKHDDIIFISESEIENDDVSLHKFIDELRKTFDNKIIKITNYRLRENFVAINCENTFVKKVVDQNDRLRKILYLTEEEISEGKAFLIKI